MEYDGSEIKITSRNFRQRLIKFRLPREYNAEKIKYENNWIQQISFHVQLEQTTQTAKNET